MRALFHSHTAAAMLLAAGVLGLSVLVTTFGSGPAPRPTARALPAAGTSARLALERCHEHVAMVYDVQWAAACLDMPDDSPDCTLPDARALPLNAWRSTAEEQCLAEATKAERIAGTRVQ